MILTGRSCSRWGGGCWTSEAMVVASSHADEIAVSRLQTLNVVANSVLVLDHVTPDHTTEVIKITPLDCKQASHNNNSMGRVEPDVRPPVAAN